MTIAAGGVGVFSKWGDRFLAEKGAGIILFLIFLIAGILVGVLAASVLKWALAALPRAGVRMVSTGDRLAEETAEQEEAWALDQALPKADGSKKSAIKRL